MDLLTEGGLVVRPPLLDETNYGYWKAHMCAFIKSMNDLTWKAILTGRTPPTKKDDPGNNVPQSELEWSSEEDK